MKCFVVIAVIAIMTSAGQGTPISDEAKRFIGLIRHTRDAPDDFVLDINQGGAVSANFRINPTYDFVIENNVVSAVDTFETRLTPSKITLNIKQVGSVTSSVKVDPTFKFLIIDGNN